VNSVKSTRAAFAGTPEFAVPSLNALVNAGVAIDCVLTQPDRRAGRGRRVSESPVKRFAIGHGIPVLQPARLDAEFRQNLPVEPPELLVVIAYGLILPQWLLDWPTVAPLNVHASLLPRWRGAAPIQQAILAGDAETGVSVMRMTRGLDAGPVFGTRATPIDAAETSGALHDRLSVLGAELLIDLLPDILSARIDPKPQDENSKTYAPKISKRDAVLDWQRSAVELARKVRAYNPWPVAEAQTVGGQRLRIWQAQAVGGLSDSAPGTVIAAENGVLEVATGEGLLRLSQVQPPGGRVMSVAAYLTAHDLRGSSFVVPE
jgi:methionyl-tRNA formyltransferase